MACEKVTYNSCKKAKQSAYAQKCKGRIAPRNYLTPYLCMKCGAWHLTSQKNN